MKINHHKQTPAPQRSEGKGSDYADKADKQTRRHAVADTIAWNEQ
jgi:hypothetical protein